MAARIPTIRARLARTELGHHSFVLHEPGWLAAAEARALLDDLRTSLSWERRSIVLFGKEVLQPRLIAWAGAVAYRYSGQTLEPRPMPAALEGIHARVCEAARAPFNHVLLNRYRDGADSMGFHADDEPELGENPVVASLSLGETRRFVLAARRGRGRWQWALGHGDLLVMGGACQHHYRHGVPKTSAAVGERVSLTFRLIVR